MILPDKVYDILKWILIVFTPALITLISTLGVIYGFNTEIITLTIGAVATFIASLIGISNINYKKNK
jgi:hypothetical protein